MRFNSLNFFLIFINKIKLINLKNFLIDLDIIYKKQKYGLIEAKKDSKCNYLYIRQ